MVTTVDARMDDESMLRLCWEKDGSLVLKYFQLIELNEQWTWFPIDLGVVKSPVMDGFLEARPLVDGHSSRFCACRHDETAYKTGDRGLT